MHGNIDIRQVLFLKIPESRKVLLFSEIDRVAQVQVCRGFLQEVPIYFVHVTAGRNGIYLFSFVHVMCLIPEEI